MHIRPATPDDAEAIARVHVDSWRATYRGIVPDATLESLSYAAHAERWQRYIADDGGSVILVAATEDGLVVGFASGGAEQGGSDGFDGELYAIYLDPAHVGQGIGTQLARACASALRDKGRRSMLVWVLADNPSRHFYEALGGEFLRAATTTIGGADLVEWAYGWRDITALAG